jgi:hypothetical protein
MFFGPHSVTHATVPAINGNLPNLKHSRIGADGQVGTLNCGLRSSAAISDERTWIENPVTAGSIQIKGDVGGLNRDSDFVRGRRRSSAPATCSCPPISWFDQTVVAVVAFVDHAEAVSIGVAKDQKLICFF